MTAKTREELIQNIASAAQKVIHKPERAWRDDIQTIAEDLVDTLFDMSQYIYKTQFDESLTTKKKVVLNLQSSYSINALRDTTSSLGGATATNVNTGEIRLSTTTDPTSYIKLQSNYRGNYVPGLEGENSVGFRISQQITGSQYVRWGYYDTNDGYGWQYDSDGLKSFSKKTGSYTYISASDYNTDIFDGTGESGLNFNPLSGTIYSINFAWYGYGDAIWQVAKTRNNVAARNSSPSRQILHTASSSPVDTRIANPNLPITVELGNNGEAEAIDAYIGGRQFSIYGDYDESKTDLVESVEEWTLTSSAGVWEPVFALKRNTDFTGIPNITFKSLDVTTNQPVMVKTTVHNTSGSAEFTNPTSYTNSTSAVLVSKTGSLSGSTLGGHLNGLQVPPFIIASTSKNNSITIRDEDTYVLPEDKTVIIWAKYSGTTPEISLVAEWEEDR